MVTEAPVVLTICADYRRTTLWAAVHVAPVLGWVEDVGRMVDRRRSAGTRHLWGRCLCRCDDHTAMLDLASCTGLSPSVM